MHALQVLLGRRHQGRQTPLLVVVGVGALPPGDGFSDMRQDLPDGHGTKERIIGSCHCFGYRVDKLRA